MLEPADLDAAARVRVALLTKTRRHALTTVQRLLDEQRRREESCAAIGHELRNALNTVAGWTALLRANPANPDQRSRAVDVIERNLRVQRKLVNDLVDASTIAGGRVVLDAHELDASKLVHEALEAITPALLAKSLELETGVAAALGTLRGDPERLRQVLANVMGNAIEFTPPAGRVRVAARRSAEYVEYCISDTGIGIAHVFDPFRQGPSDRARSSGLGLGLTIAKHLVQSHGGRIVAESPGAGAGATFRICLPGA